MEWKGQFNFKNKIIKNTFIYFNEYPLKKTNNRYVKINNMDLGDRE